MNRDKRVALGSSSHEFMSFATGELERRKNSGSDENIEDVEAAIDLINRKLQVLEEEGML